MTAFIHALIALMVLAHPGSHQHHVRRHTPAPAPTTVSAPGNVRIGDALTVERHVLPDGREIEVTRVPGRQIP